MMGAFVLPCLWAIAALNQPAPLVSGQFPQTPEIETTPSDRYRAQVPPPGELPDLSPEETPPLPEPRPIPAPEDLLPVPPAAPSPQLPPATDVTDTFVVERFSFVGNTVFSEAALQAVVAGYLDRPLTLNDLFVARTAITQTYVDGGYINSGAFLPTQRITGGVVEIRIVEGRLEAINIEGLRRLKPKYIRQRIQARTGQPLNVANLVEALQLLQLDPLIEDLSADLSAGATTGGSTLNLAVTEADAVSGIVELNNARSPLVGTFQRRASFSHNNLTTRGDRFTVGYGNTNGSNSWSLDYAYPLNAENGTLSFTYSGSRSEVITPELEVLNIESKSDRFELGLRQPVVQTPRTELALGLSLSYERSGSTFQLAEFDREAFPIDGADDEGNTRVTALRFSQEWTQRQATEVIALRSQFSLGTDWFGATRNDGDTPDSEFFSWQGQAQYLKVFPNNTLLLFRLNGQIADEPLLSIEEFRLGGQGSVRGYRQDELTTDNGLFTSLEVRFPVINLPNLQSSMQLAPFVDYGLGINSGTNTTEELLSVGIGMVWQLGDRVSARVDYGVPLIDAGPEGDSLQEQGLLLTLTAELF